MGYLRDLKHFYSEVSRRCFIMALVMIITTGISGIAQSYESAQQNHPLNEHANAVSTHTINATVAVPSHENNHRTAMQWLMDADNLSPLSRSFSHDRKERDIETYSGAIRFRRFKILFLMVHDERNNETLLYLSIENNDSSQGISSSTSYITTTDLTEEEEQKIELQGISENQINEWNEEGLSFGEIKPISHPMNLLLDYQWVGIL